MTDARQRHSAVEGEREQRDDKAHAGQCDYDLDHVGSIGRKFLTSCESTSTDRKSEQARERRRLSRERRRRGQRVLTITLLDEDACADLMRLTGHLQGEGHEALRTAIETYLNDMARG